MNVGSLIKQRLEELKLDQKDLASAAGVTDSYVSQLLARKKLPPLPGRTDIYTKIGRFLRVPADKLSELAAHERAEELKKKLPDSPLPLHKELRNLVLSKCAPAKEKEVRAIFERQPFGELERLVTQKLLDVVKKVARQELESEKWLRVVGQLSGHTYEEVRVNILEFLEADVFDISADNCLAFLDPLVDSWDINLGNFGMDVVLNRRLSAANRRKLEFVEKESGTDMEPEPGLTAFLHNRSMSGDASEEELEFLKRLAFTASRPTALYYYRELQNLRDPLNFRETSVAPSHKYGDSNAVERQMQMHARRSAILRWSKNKSSQSGKKRKRKAGR